MLPGGRSLLPHLPQNFISPPEGFPSHHLKANISGNPSQDKKQYGPAARGPLGGAGQGHPRSSLLRRSRSSNQGCGEHWLP